MHDGASAVADGEQISRQLLSGLVSIGGILLESFENHRLKIARDGRVQFARRHGIGVNGFVLDGKDGISSERLVACRHPVEHDGDGK